VSTPATLLKLPLRIDGPLPEKYRMNDVAIRAENLSKLYRLGKRQLYRTLRDSLWDTFAAPFRPRRPGASCSREPETFWALKDVSFELKHGEVIGIIGRNGAGKSTLLKLLSRITEPTEGHAEIHGRVGSLLEVGTGFHPELTGRENIFLNGAILGMRNAEVLRKFDEIVAFAEVERYIDTPVKHYSSGMYMRLAFAVAAYLEPEILVVDEVLAVGDSHFQKKCLGKMGEVARQGRTVLFVSHNLSAVRTLCSRAILLKRGELVEDGCSDEVINAYEHVAAETRTEWARAHGSGHSPLFFNAIRCNLLGEQPQHTLQITAELESTSVHRPAFIAFDIVHRSHTPIMQAIPTHERIIGPVPRCKRITASVCLPPLIPGVYGVQAWVGSHFSETLDFVAPGPSFTISSSPTPDRTYPHSFDHGFLVPNSSMIIDDASI
jgi:lipopolysaccharide transport system ATP-binding protein